MKKIYAMELNNISKKYDEDYVIKNIDLKIEKNEFVSLLGPSGCGKTTLLRIIGGFEEANSGSVIFEGQDITNKLPYKRQINTVFQKYALFPHMNVYENISFALKLKKINKIEIKKRVSEVLNLVNLDGFELRKISSLSGGQQQRVAIARALVNKPRILLLDEPLSALDLKLRKDMQMELKKIQKELGITFIFVTHDQEEALTMSDKIVVLHEGKIQQIGSPVDIYNEPKNKFVANFIGDSNILDGRMLEDYKVKFADRVFNCVDKGFTKNYKVDVVIRPEDLEVVEKSQAQIKARVTSIVFKGVHYELIARDTSIDWLVHTTRSFKLGDNIYLKIEADNIHVMSREDE